MLKSKQVKVIIERAHSAKHLKWNNCNDKTTMSC